MLNPEVKKAIKYLAEVCDGAQSKDGQGFNKFDTEIGHKLANKEDWSINEMSQASVLIDKYHDQLTKAGFNVDSSLMAKPEKTAELVDGKIQISFPYDKQLVEVVRTIPGRQWNSIGKVWTCPVSKKAVEILQKNEFYITSDVMQAVKDIKEEVKELPAKRAVLKQDQIEITFPFDWKTVDLVKTIPERKFNSSNKTWSCSVSEKAVEILKKNGFYIDPAIIEILHPTDPNGGKPEDKIEDKKENPEKAVENAPIKRELFPFQKDGVKFIEKKKGRALIADEMGLGKTIQALTWIAMHPEKRPVIIVVPSSLKLNWAQEIKKTFLYPPSVEVLYGTKPYPVYSDIIIINYDILSKWVDNLIELHPQVLIVDEAHFIKNNSAQRTKAVKKLAKGIPHVIALTGTPIINRPVEGFNIINIIDKNIFPNFWTYVHKYCGAHQTPFGWDFSGATNKDELHDILSHTIMIRRKKEDVLKELPNKMYSYIPIDIDNRNEYNKAEMDFINYLRKSKGKEAAEKAQKAEHLVKIEALKQLCLKGKVKQAIEWIRNLIETNGKLVVFAIHKEAIDILMNEFGDVAVKVDGTTNGQQRDEAVKAFQENPNIRLFVGNIKAAGVGLTLTAASDVAFLEFPWTPGELVQAEDRCHRIGQKNAVNVYYLLADDTIEYKIAEMLDEKRNTLDAVLDGKETSDVPLLTELINAYQNKEEK